jgi:general stress protein YciG
MSFSVERLVTRWILPVSGIAVAALENRRTKHMEENTEGRNTPRAPGAGNPGNFANNREKAVEAGRRGGQHSHGGGGAGNNPGNFANNRQRAAEAGRKGGMQPRR